MILSEDKHLKDQRTIYINYYAWHPLKLPTYLVAQKAVRSPLLRCLTTSVHKLDTHCIWIFLDLAFTPFCSHKQMRAPSSFYLVFPLQRCQFFQVIKCQPSKNAIVYLQFANIPKLRKESF